MEGLFELESVLPALRSIGWRELGVGHVILFGSLAVRGRGGDVDLLVLPAGMAGRGSGDDLWAESQMVGRILSEVAEAVRAPYHLVDIVLASDDTPCPIVGEAWANGVIVYTRSREELREWLLSRLSICLDYELQRRKLRVVETALSAGARRWRGDRSS